MNKTNTVRNVAQNAFKLAQEPLETLKSQIAKPMAEEMGAELGAFFGTPRSLSSRPKALAQEDLQRARQEQAIEEKRVADKNESEAQTHELVSSIKQEYKTFEIKSNNEQHQLKEEVIELQEEIAKLAKTSGVDTKAHLQNTGNKVGKIDIKFLTSIVRALRVKADESKSAKELISQRQNAKRTTGMLAWVSGKQMKVHEQGTLTLQG